MKKILVVDWLDKYGGAERVLTSLNKSFNFSRCYTLINNMSEENLKKVFQHNDIEIIESPLKLLKSKFRYLFFLFPYFISNLSQEKNKCLIISSSFAVGKGFRSKKNQLHICYFQARNQRYIWDEENIYFTKLQAFILNPILYLLRKIDIRQSKRPDFIVANSFFVKDWIKKHYKIDCEVIYPPVDTKLFKLEKNKSGYYITTARLEPYKRIDLIVDAFNNINEELYIVGDGSTKKSLKAKANENIKFYDFLDAESVMNLVSKAKAFIHAGIEDFGIAPVEAQSCGTPVIAFNKGGVSETVVDGKTGVLFEYQTAGAILDAIKRFNKIKFNYRLISEHAANYSEEKFISNVKKYVESKLHNLKDNNEKEKG